MTEDMSREATAQCTFVVDDVLDYFGLDEDHRERVDEWLPDNSKHIVGAMCVAGWDAIGTLNSLDPIESEEEE